MVVVMVGDESRATSTTLTKAINMVTKAMCQMKLRVYQTQVSLFQLSELRTPHVAIHEVWSYQPKQNREAQPFVAPVPLGGEIWRAALSATAQELGQLLASGADNGDRKNTHAWQA